jgi:hypothetical protein
MLVEEKVVKEEIVGYYDAIFDSSNILQTTYFPQQERLYISFNRGGVYSYENFPHEKYREFKNAESQGKYFIQEIKNKPDEHPYRKEFTLYPNEIENLKEQRDNKKEEIDSTEIAKPNYHKIIDWIERELKHFQNKNELTQFEEGQLYELKILKQWI